jgi:hypothetical protein
MPSKDTTPIAVRLPNPVIALIEEEAKAAGITAHRRLRNVICDAYEWTPEK